MIQQLINDQRFTNIQTAQSGLTKLFTAAEKTNCFYTVLRNDEQLGVLLPKKMWMSLIEDLEAMSSPDYRARIAAARKEKRVTAGEIKKLLRM